MGAMLAFGVIFGLISDQTKDLEGSAAEWYTRIGGTDQIEHAYLTSMIKLAGMAVAIYVVQTLARMRAEEAEGHLEPILAAAISRRRWAMSHVLNAGLGAVALLLAYVAGIGIAAGSVLGDTPGQLRAAATASVVQLPAISVIGAAVIAATGLLPRWTSPIAWAVLVFSILLGPLFGATVQLPHWAQDISPFTHVPNAPATAIAAMPIIALIAISAALAMTGFASFRRRNLALPT
jgi:ABC-2 type transport system permease protein